MTYIAIIFIVLSIIGLIFTHKLGKETNTYSPGIILYMRPDIGPDPAKPSTGDIIGIIFLLLLLLIYVIGI